MSIEKSGTFGPADVNDIFRGSISGAEFTVETESSSLYKVYSMSQIIIMLEKVDADERVLKDAGYFRR